MEDSGQGSSPGVICLQSRHVCYSDLDTAAKRQRKLAPGNLAGSCSLEGWPRKCFTTMPALVQHLKFKALEGCGSESSQLTHHCASKSFPPRQSIQSAQCVFMPSVLSMCQLLGPKFPFPIVTPVILDQGIPHRSHLTSARTLFPNKVTPGGTGG